GTGSTATGPVTFGFNAKYLAGTTTPQGNVEFQFKAGNINFHATSVTALIVTSEPRARILGSGTINGSTPCSYQVDAWNNSFVPSPGAAPVDAFGIEISSCGGATGDFYNLPTTPLTKGSIVIHQ